MAARTGYDFQFFLFSNFNYCLPASTLEMSPMDNITGRPSSNASLITSTVPFFEKGLTDKKLPQVIEETIQPMWDIEEKLDRRHLHSPWLSWTLKADINAMDAVYAYSLATIIAASGFNSTSHLPGASGIPRPLRLPPIHGLVNGIEASTWSKRAWTYQEGLISWRQLVFTDQEVFFICVEDLFAESCTEPPGGTSQLVPYSRLQSLTISTLKELPGSSKKFKPR